MSGDQIILSNGQTIILDAGIIVDGELSVNSVVALVACANGDVIDIISITVIYTPIELPPPSPGDDGDGDGNGGQETRINVCHKPGTPAEKTLSLPQPAVPAHLGHGDTEGACGN
jgi:hypothetical protein